MDRDGADKPGDWDSLSDRMRKARRHQRAIQHKQQQLLQKNGIIDAMGIPPAAAIGGGVADRKDALTERPLDFDREEQTRKGETMKWLENHFGSELSTSSSSNSGDAPTRDIISAPTKKTFFNVTIKSSPTAPSGGNNSAPVPPTTVPVASSSSVPLISPSKVIIPERDGELLQPLSQHFHQTHQARQTATLERFRHLNKQLHRQHFAGGSREDLLAISRKNEQNRIGLHELQQEVHRPPQVNNSMIDLRTTAAAGREYMHPPTPFNAHHLQQQHARKLRARSIDPLPYGSKPPAPPLHHKEDLGYLSGSRNDVRPNTLEKPIAKSQPNTIANAAAAVALHRKDSGYVRGSRDDVHAPSQQQQHRNHAVSRDYASGPEETGGGSSLLEPSLHIVPIQQRPAVPQRRHKPSTNVQLQQPHTIVHMPATYHPEPHPDYPRSRSLTPPVSPRLSPGHRTPHQQLKQQQQLQTTTAGSNLPTISPFTQSTQTLNRSRRPNHHKATVAPQPPPPLLLQHQHSAKSMSIIDSEAHHHRPQHLPAQQQPPQRPKSSVSAVIGNSIRKLVGRIRSVSTDRRQRNKAAKLEKLQQQQQTQQRRRDSQSPTRSADTHYKQTAGSGSNNKSLLLGPHSSGSSSVNLNNNHKNGGGSTYTQYNVIDGHIGDEELTTLASESELTVIKPPPATTTTTTKLLRDHHHRAASQVYKALNYSVQSATMFQMRL